MAKAPKAPEETPAPEVTLNPSEDTRPQQKGRRTLTVMGIEMIIEDY